MTETEQRSHFNFVYGCYLVVYLLRLKLLKPTVSNFAELSPVEKLRHLLQTLEKQFPELYTINLETYRLDDETESFIDEEGLAEFRKIRDSWEPKSHEEALLDLENYFKSCF